MNALTSDHVRREASVIALTEAHVAGVTGLSIGQLRAWDRRGLFVPQLASQNRRIPFGRVYSFKDVVALRAIAILKRDYKISTQKLVKVAKQLEAMGFDHWTDVKLYVLKKEVSFQLPNSDIVEGMDTGQRGMLPIIEVIEDVESKVEQLKVRRLDQHGKIEKGKHIAHNAAVVSGTRIPTSTIRRFLDAGYTPLQVIKEYPSLTLKDINAAIAYEKNLLEKAG